MDAFLVATGTGIVPFRAMLQDLFVPGTERRIQLIYGTRYAESLLWVAEFQAAFAARGLKVPNGAVLRTYRSHLQENAFRFANTAGVDLETLARVEAKYLR